MKPKLPRMQPIYGNFINDKFVKDFCEKKGKRFSVCMEVLKRKNIKTND